MRIHRWCLFFDFHTMPACPDVGRRFDFEAMANWFAECGVTRVVFPARCNLGTAYYDTRIGIRHPSLEYDLLGTLTRACHARGVALGAYINVGLSHEEGLRRREWLVLPESGETYQKDRLDHFFRMMCYHTGYADHVTAMAREVVERCDVDGLFLDCMHTPPCIGHECMTRMKAEGVDWRDAEQLHDFNYRKIVGMARRIATEAKALKRDLEIYCNGVDYEAQAEFGTYVEFECLPMGGWGYEMLPVGARYLRTLGKPVLNQTGRFHRSWGDFGGIRTEASIEYDCLYGVANGVGTSIGDHFHPRGDLNRAVMELDRRVYRRLQELDPWLDGAVPVVEAAVPMLMPYPGYKYSSPAGQQRFNRQFNALKAATRMLCELKMQFDVPSHACGWDRYRLLVLADYVALDAETARRVRAHLDGGGAVLATGWSGLDPQYGRFLFADWGLRFRGDEPSNAAYVQAGGALAEGMPDMPVSLYDRGIAVEALPGTAVLATIVAPYHDRHWDGEHGFVYMPPDRPTDRPAVTLKGNVAHVTHPVFTTYHNCAPLPLRQIVANLLGRLLPKPLLRAPGAPSFSRMTVTRQGDRRMVHVLGYVPEQRGAGTNMIEEPITMLDVHLELRADGRPPRRVYLAPRGDDLAFEVAGDYVRVTLDRVDGYALVVFEE